MADSITIQSTSEFQWWRYSAIDTPEQTSVSQNYPPSKRSQVWAANISTPGYWCHEEGKATLRFNHNLPKSTVSKLTLHVYVRNIVGGMNDAPYTPINAGLKFYVGNLGETPNAADFNSVGSGSLLADIAGTTTPGWYDLDIDVGAYNPDKAYIDIDALICPDIDTGLSAGYNTSTFFDLFSGWDGYNQQIYGASLDIEYTTWIKTLDATVVERTSAQLNGSCDLDQVSDVHFEYGIAAVTENTTANQNATPFFALVENLEPGKLYQFRAVGTKNEAPIYGDTLCFQWDKWVKTDAATNAIDRQATVNGESNNLDIVWFEFGPGQDALTRRTAAQPASASFSDILVRLQRLATYYFRAAGMDSDGYTYYGDTLQFTLVNGGSPAYVTVLNITGEPLVPLETITLYADDTPSQTKYRKRSLAISTQVTFGQDDTQDQLDMILEENKDPHVVGLKVTINNIPKSRLDELVRQDISSRILVKHTKLGINAEYFINKLTHTIQQGKAYSIQWILEKVFQKPVGGS